MLYRVYLIFRKTDFISSTSSYNIDSLLTVFTFIIDPLYSYIYHHITLVSLIYFLSTFFLSHLFFMSPPTWPRLISSRQPPPHPVGKGGVFSYICTCTPLCKYLCSLVCSRLFICLYFGWLCKAYWYFCIFAYFSFCFVLFPLCFHLSPFIFTFEMFSPFFLRFPSTCLHHIYFQRVEMYGTVFFILKHCALWYVHGDFLR